MTNTRVSYLESVKSRSTLLKSTRCRRVLASSVISFATLANCSLKLVASPLLLACRRAGVLKVTVCPVGGRRFLDDIEPLVSGVTREEVGDSSYRQVLVSTTALTHESRACSASIRAGSG